MYELWILAHCAGVGCGLEVGTPAARSQGQVGRIRGVRHWWRLWNSRSGEASNIGRTL